MATDSPLWHLESADGTGIAGGFRTEAEAVAAARHVANSTGRTVYVYPEGGDYTAIGPDDA
jgi:hypothetical protein